MPKSIYNPSLRLQKTKEGKTYLDRIRKLSPYERLCYWIAERHKIHCRRFGLKSTAFGQPAWKETPATAQSAAGPVEAQPAPWTPDPILKTIFFCNPYRENDKVTGYLRDNFRDEYKNDPCVFLGTILLRMFNFIPTMRLLINAGIPQRLGGDKAKGKKALTEMRNFLVARRDVHDMQIFGGAYIIIFPPGMQKVEAAYKTMMGLLDTFVQLKGAMFENTMEDAFQTLRGFWGIGQFYAYQYIGDLAYTHVLRDATGWDTWGYCGPGTARGLYRLQGITEINGVPLERRCPAPKDATEQLLALQKRVNKFTKTAKIPHLHMRDLCNCLCEYDKYCRALGNERHVKRPYSGE